MRVAQAILPVNHRSNRNRSIRKKHMIHFIMGKLGSGKSLVTMGYLIQELTTGHRDIVTNLPIRTEPWVNGAGQAQTGLFAFLRKKYGQTFQAEKRLKIITELKEQYDMFMWRRDPETDIWFKLPVYDENDKCLGPCEKGWHKDAVRFDAEPAKNCAPVMCVTDEAWQFYPARSWQKIPHLLEFYAKQQRKLGDEWYIISQHHKDVDVLLHRITQDFTVCRNHGHEKLALFRQPSLFHTMLYIQPPNDRSARVMVERYFKLDAAGLAQTYDTSAGVGVQGGFAADRQTKVKGLHIGWLGVGVAVIIGLLALFPIVSGKAAGAMLRGGMGGIKAPKGGTNTTTTLSVGTNSVPVQTNSAEVATLQLPQQPQKDIKITGVAPLGTKDIAILLSDGATVRMSSGRVKYLGEDFAIIDDRRVDWKRNLSQPYESNLSDFRNERNLRSDIRNRGF